ncbi:MULTISPECIES: transketolase C-terminal domain-containing protein [unclassified Actinomyces]|uniref:transketolase family protein n=1 Tax=unclassified Actinomyces TaxID=2609248 RepID=UPI0020178DCB|nr:MULTISPECIES: transketolase C-terminal domain-containing protein [unclassified Actinomyces]MCL3777320.1 transketolase family protein [Actinomyces sp. AC-20-1]MCL3789656.1 transketolase family protein [Actinomyces sp. 187325]MCL3792179.1 transketolase family protein [Actinomyces sp. 186855]MCL3794811.1 transketolase family protein [Actinomyces sp. 217892]
MTELFDCRQAYVATLTDIARDDDRLVVVVNDSVGSSNLGGFQKEFPGRLINVGIAEQNQVGVAAGLENGGKIPVVSCAGSFLSARATEQVKIDAGYSQRHMLLCAQSPGLAYGQLGSTHHSAEDVSIMRSFPGMTVIIPADPAETAGALRWAYHELDGPAYIRISRMKVPAVHGQDYEFTPKAVTLREGTDVTVIANGTTVHRALEGVDRLAAEGVSARLLSIPVVKPLDEEAVLAAARQTGRIITIEEGTIKGGLGGAVAELTAERCPVPVRRLGVPDEWAPTGSEAWLMDHWGISADGVVAAARELLA